MHASNIFPLGRARRRHITSRMKSAPCQQTNENALQSWRVIAIERRRETCRGFTRPEATATARLRITAVWQIHHFTYLSLSYISNDKRYTYNHVYINYPVNLFSQMAWVCRAFAAYMDRTPLLNTEYRLIPTWIHKFNKREIHFIGFIFYCIFDQLNEALVSIRVFKNNT